MRRRRLSFRVWHRGMREVDLLLGWFADAHLAELDEGELSAFEELLDVPDPEIMAWILGEAEIPPERDSGMLRRIIVFHSRRGKAWR
jgi:antitoxin CptB